MGFRVGLWWVVIGELLEPGGEEKASGESSVVLGLGWFEQAERGRRYDGKVKDLIMAFHFRYKGKKCDHGPTKTLIVG